MAFAPDEPQDVFPGPPSISQYFSGPPAQLGRPLPGRGQDRQEFEHEDRRQAQPLLCRDHDAGVLALVLEEGPDVDVDLALECRRDIVLW